MSKPADHEKQLVALVTGASSGIGEACATALARQGYRVFGASRHPSSVTSSSNMIPMEMDVSSTESVEAAVAAIRRTAGRIDVLVNNAGYSLVGSIEDTSDEEARSQIETNFFGAWRLCRAVLPTMREQRDGGHIINIGSIGGRIGLPFQAAYSASKFALAGFTEALSGELRGWPIRVVLIELGDYRTSITANRKVAARATEKSAYASRLKVARRRIAEAEERGRPPSEVANLVLRVIDSAAPRLSYQAGPALERLALVAKAVLPSRIFERLLIRQYS
jgi:NAD(P)-dependent dehydrogenase (short-subunit alcohol dehydrogenase family)